MELKLTPKQHKMIYDLQDVDEMLWGGQAGGGKSEGLLMFALKRRVECPGSVGLMLRRTFPELDKSLIRKSKRYFKPFADWKEGKRHWQFKPMFGNSIQEFGYSENDKDVEQYQSAEYDDICFDELTHFTEYQYTYMRSRLRGQGGWKTLMRSASNPGSKGHAWVKAYFVDPAREKTHKEWDEVLGTFKTRYFMPASLDDNTLMTEQQRKEYKAWLAGLPEADRKMLMEGDWDYIPGAALPELSRKTHSYKDILVPKWAKIIMTFDWGFGKPFSVGWWWVDYDGRMWRFNEWYGWNGKADQGMRMAPSGVAKGIISREEAMGISGRVYDRQADPSVFARTPNLRGGGQGPSVAEMVENEGIYLNPADNDRLQGKMQFHERLRVPDDGSLPMMMVHENCVNFWRTVPTLALDKNDIEDIDTDQEDHIYDECRYGLMSRPLVPVREKIEEGYCKKIIKETMNYRPRDILEEIYDY